MESRRTTLDRPASAARQAGVEQFHAARPDPRDGRRRRDVTTTRRALFEACAIVVLVAAALGSSVYALGRFA